MTEIPGAEAAALSQPMADGLDPVAVAPADAAGAAFPKIRLSRGAISWALYQGVRDPFVILISIYIFAPYFATTVVGDPVRGQALIANIGMIYGLMVAVIGPVLGSSIDQFGHRKPLLLGVTTLMVPLIAALWWAKPEGAGLSVTAISLILIAVNLLFVLTEVLHNSLLTGAAGRRGAPAASGLALSLGNAVSVLMLVFVLWAFALPGHVDWGVIPKAPLFGLDPAQHEPDRIVGPLVAAAFAVGCMPLFLFTPDARATGVGLITGLRRGVVALGATLRGLKGQRDAATYLISRMLFNDGMTALLLFGGIYAAGVMRWGVLEMLAYGISLSVFAVGGGFVGAWLDNHLGPKRAVQIEIFGVLVCLLAMLGMGREQILYLWAYDPAAHAPLWNGPMFRTAPELIYLAIGFGVATFVTASYASSRVLLARLAPPDQLASFFGLYAVSGTVTVWLGSFLVKTATNLTHSQQAGFAPIAGLLLVGLIGMALVKGGGREA
ncbi:MAG: transporter [Caulobacter sp.]|nr:transporter [Caulobacter sp.]